MFDGLRKSVIKAQNTLNNLRKHPLKAGVPLILLIVLFIGKEFLSGVVKKKGELWATQHFGSLVLSQTKYTTYRVAFLNRSSVLKDLEIKDTVDALQTQVHRDFAPIWGID